MRSMTVEERRWTVGLTLENQRNKLGLSLDQVAKRAGVARATVRYYETGYRADNGAPVKPTVKVLRPLAEALKLDVNEVLVLAGIQPARRQTDEEAAAEVARRSSHLADRIAQLPPEFRSAVETIVDEYLKAKGYVDDGSGVLAKSGPEEQRNAAAAFGPEEPPLGEARDQAPLNS